MLESRDRNVWASRCTGSSPEQGRYCDRSWLRKHSYASSQYSAQPAAVTLLHLLAAPIRSALLRRARDEAIVHERRVDECDRCAADRAGGGATLVDYVLIGCGIFLGTLGSVLINLGNNMQALAMHRANSIKAKALFRNDKEYVVMNGEVLIVDEFSGRVMEGRRWGDGLHQAIEAKEGLEVQPETEVIASITYQSLFRRFEKLSSMSGTALTEAEEMCKVYELDIVAVPPVLPMQRVHCHVDVGADVHLGTRHSGDAMLVSSENESVS